MTFYVKNLYPCTSPSDKKPPDDYSQVGELITLAFRRAREAKLVDALRMNRDEFIAALSLVATMDQRIVGHILFSRIKIVRDYQPDFASLALAPLAVIPQFQRRRIGETLRSRGLKIWPSLNFTSAIVLGHSRYYTRFELVRPRNGT